MKIYRIKGKILVVCLLLLLPLTMMGQQERKYIRKGNRLYEKENYSGSETQYHRAEGIDKLVPDANFNVGDALYKQNKYSEASENYDEAISSYKDPAKQAEAYYNQGNALLKENKFKESIQAYINSLKITPDNMKAKYNLAYAQDQLKKQEEEQKKQQEQQQKQDQEKQKNKDQDKNQDKQDKQDQNKDQNNNQQNPDQNQNQDQNQQGQPQPQGMTKEDAKRLLDALSANEKEVQEKVKKDKMSQGQARVVKNW